MSKKYPTAQSPLVLRFHRMMEAFSKSDDERDFYLDRIEGFLLFIDLDKGEEELEAFYKELKENEDRYLVIPKLTFYETKKFMEGFVNEKIYDIDTKEKLLDIISGSEPRENFLEFIYDHLTELEKWQQYYNERSRIRVIEWLRQCNIHFVFEEDIEIPRVVMEKVKLQLFDEKVPKDVVSARSALEAKAKMYYSSEALNPRPKRGRPPKQQAKVELEPQFTPDFYRQVPSVTRPFLFIPEYNSHAITFSSKFSTEAELLASLKGSVKEKVDTRLEMLSQRLESLRHLSGRLTGIKDQELGRETDFFKQITASIGSGATKEKEAGLSAIQAAFSDSFPKKRGRPRKQSEDLQEFIEKKKNTRVKTVTPIHYKTQPKDEE